MADPLGIAGTAAGLVSLGLQLYGEISKYIKAVKGREEDLRAARQNAEILRKCLNAIKGATASSNTARTASKDAVDECIASVKDELKQLEDLLTRLRGSESPSDTLSAKARKKGRQLLYPFHKDSIVDLEQRLASTNDVLQTALHALGINVSLTMQSAIVDLQSDATAIKLSTENNSKKISQVSNVVGEIRESSRLIPEIHAQAAATTLSMVQQTEALAQTTQISIRVEENTQVIRQQVDSGIGRLEELLTQLVVANSAGVQNTQKQFGQLLARPSDLRTLCDGFLSTGPHQSPKSNLFATQNELQARGMSMGYRLCPCMRRRYTQRHSRSFGPLVFDTEMCEVKHHAAECPFSQLKPPEQRAKRWLSISVPGFQSLLKKAVRLSFGLSTGAGGSTFSQSLSWVATVDPKTSPAFRILKIALKAIDCCYLSEVGLQTILGLCCRRIFWCYAQKTASPTDVDQHGMTLLGNFVDKVQFYSAANIAAVDFAAFVQALIALGLSVNGRASTFRDEPIYACIARSPWFMEQDAAQILMDAMRGSYDPEEGFTNGYGDRRKVLQAFQLFQIMPDLAKMLQFAPLMLGILRQDLGTVSHQLNNNPLSIFETNYCGQTPVHIAVLAGNAPVLELVLSFSNERLLNTRDAYSYYPIDYMTVRQLHDACHTRCVSNCEGCVMLEALLNAGSGLWPQALQLGLGVDDDFTQNLSFAVREILLRHLKERRTKLQDLAKEQLPKEKRRGLISLTNCVLDRHATRVQKLLEDQFVHIPLYLKVYNEYDATEPSGTPGTIYAYICDQATAELAWGLGFRDIGSDLMDGLYQVLRGVLTAHVTSRRAIQNLSVYVSWLVDRGLDLERPIPATLLPEGSPHRSDPKNTGAHYFMRLLGGATAYTILEVHATLTLPKKLSEIFFSQIAVDSCSCRCSPSGCSPLMKYLAYSKCNEFRKGSIWVACVPSICKMVLWLATQNKWQSPSYFWIYRAVLRRITFDALSLQHSCCAFDNGEFCTDDEDRYLLFENLCVEFETKCGGNSELMQFVEDTWQPRVLYELDQLDRQKRLTAEERLAAQEIGVNWDSDSTDTSICDDEYIHSIRDDEYIHDPYFPRIWRELGDIMPEPDVQLPCGFRMI